MIIDKHIMTTEQRERYEQDTAEAAAVYLRLITESNAVVFEVRHLLSQSDNMVSTSAKIWT